MSRSGHLLPKLGAALAVLTLAGCATSPSSNPVIIPSQSSAPPADYLVQPGDVLELKFYYHADHNQDAVVRADGKLVLPLIGEVEAAGRTPGEVAKQISQRYSANLRNPEVSVAVKAMNQSKVYVGGEVIRPGFVQYRPGLTAVQALLDAGGPKDTARVEEVVLLKKIGEDQYKPSKIDLAKVLQGDADSDLVLGPADVIFVPKTGIARLNVYVEQYIIKMLPFRPSIPF